MKPLSLWAKYHVVPARILIIGSHLILWIIAFFLAKELGRHSLIIPGGLVYAVTVMFLICVLIYPRRQGAKSSYYFKRKSIELVVGACSFFAMLFFCKEVCFTEARSSFRLNPIAASSVEPRKPTAGEILVSLKTRDKATLTKTEKRILKKEFRRQLVVFAKAKIRGDQQESDRAALIIIAVIGAVGLTALIAALACNLSCSGQEGAALAVLILGIGGIVWGLVAIIKAIKKKTRKEDLSLQSNT